MSVPNRALIIFLGGKRMNEKDIQEVLELGKVYREAIKEYNELNRDLRKALIEVKELQKNLQELIDSQK